MPEFRSPFSKRKKYQTSSASENDGKIYLSDLPVQPLFQKYFRSHLTQITSISPAVPARERGVSRSSRTLGMGCGGRGSVVARGESQGGLSIEGTPVSIPPARGRTALLPPSLKPQWTCTCHRVLLAKAGRGRQSPVVLAPVAGVKLAEVHAPYRAATPSIRQ
jgi:hypothetical protein